ncbi:hypothetical protein [Pseudomonas asplenii]|uniref:hypothetical protein n=1 Tax=Pseudomonas asplenii TaxID=53407 RepID=UPI0006B4537D|nr:hypothetical protein [Pseudomonas fuscovaginae]KPA96928.1 hypothetical protein PF70_03084 [Pseudomonas fuscovaginae]
MTAYSLTGTLKDNEGKTVIVGEFTSNPNRNARNVEFYATNGFTGELTLTRTHFDGNQSVEKLVVGGVHQLENA